MGELQDEKARKALGRKLKLARKNKKLTQEKVADKADISVNYYARIERGEENPSFDVLHSVSRALGVKLSDVLPS
jgi:transcriptional regulator with XRE-family HTH domain